MRLELVNKNNRLTQENVCLYDADTGDMIRGIKWIKLCLNSDRLPLLRFAIHSDCDEFGKININEEAFSTLPIKHKSGKVVYDTYLIGIDLDKKEITYECNNFDVNLISIKPYKKQS